jgi:ribosomal peptide maturation radical SAM protein 1
VEGFLEWCRQELVRARPRLVGFTSMFQQHVASLALARRLKQSLPETFVVFGGANCADVMGAETVRRFPFVDAVVSGEADLVFPELARRVLERRPVSGLPGVWTRETAGPEDRVEPGPMAQDLDALPYPDYGDYFRQFASSRYGAAWQPQIYIETSRGCWWGQRSQCTFCGLYPWSLAFRSKSARRALDELVWLTRRHPGCAVEATDNVLDTRYLDGFLPALASRRHRATLFYEVRASLRKEQPRPTRRRGPPHPAWIESPATGAEAGVKGTSALQNIQVLKWCKELGIETTWNPSGARASRRKSARAWPGWSWLQHLLRRGGVMRLDRFSPSFEDADRQFADVRPLPAYRYVHALPDEALARLACFFAFRYRTPRVGAYGGAREAAGPLAAGVPGHDPSPWIGTAGSSCGTSGR